MAGLRWDKEAEQRLGKVPIFVRPLVRRNVEELVLKRGGESVDLSVFREAETARQAAPERIKDKNIMRSAPLPNQPGVEMVHLESCNNEINNCPNVLIKTSDYLSAIEDWAREKNISEKLRALVTGGRIRFHNKLRISVSGCPNGCSKPQIADIGIAGSVSPLFDPAECASCGACEEACPDQAIEFDGGLPLFNQRDCLGCNKCSRACLNHCISMTEPGVRIIVGGKLGRHPRLAETVCEADSPAETVNVIDRLVDDYIKHAGPDERFSDYWERSGRERFRSQNQLNKQRRLGS